MRPREYETMFQVEETHWWYAALHRLIFDTLEERLPGWREKNILDAGCGTGAILQRLGNPAKHIGVDLAPEAIAFCRQRGLCNVREADICALPFPNSAFDAVICSSVLYHQWVPDVPDALRELQRVLQPGGIVIVNLPAYNFLHSAHDEAVMTSRRFIKHEVRSLLDRAGFAVQYISYWTTFLFPLAILARTLRGSRSGRDFDVSHQKPGIVDRMFSIAMRAELPMMKRLPLPFGVAIFAVASKSKESSRSLVPIDAEDFPAGKIFKS